jgi:hypothetical protein
MNADNDFALDFAMLDLPVRPGPCRKAAAEEVDPIEARIEHKRARAERVAREAEERALAAGALSCNATSIRTAVYRREVERPECVEVQWGSGKVKV